MQLSLPKVSLVEKDEKVQEEDVEYNAKQANEKVAYKKDHEVLEPIECGVVNKDDEHLELVRVNNLEKVSGAKEMIRTKKEASTKSMVIDEQDMNLKDYFRIYVMQPCRGFIYQKQRRRVSNNFLIKEDPPNAPPPQRDKFLSSYMMKNTNALCVGAGYTLSRFDINFNFSTKTPTILSKHYGVLTALKEPHTRLDLTRTESPTQKSNYSPSP
ncbi:unnamed protein product [Cochlearia groenlandica]